MSDYHRFRVHIGINYTAPPDWMVEAASILESAWGTIPNDVWLAIQALGDAIIRLDSLDERGEVTASDYRDRMSMMRLDMLNLLESLE